MKSGITLSTAVLLAVAILAPLAGPAIASEAATVLYLDRTVVVEETLEDPTDLWVRPADLTRINDFVLKPEGACLDDLCIPVQEDSGILVERDGEQWFSVTGFANKLEQAFVADQAQRVWSFGVIPPTRSSFLQSALAPDFALSDREGNTVRLSDFRGKKVLLLTWASW